MDRNETIATVRKNLNSRAKAAGSATRWTVRGGRGTAWGWITITAAPRCNPDGWMDEAQRAELGDLLGFDRPVHAQGSSIMASGDARQEYVQRSAGQEPTVVGVPYWD